ATPGFHFRPVDDNPSLSWVEGFSWTRQHSTYLPTCFVYQSPCQGAGECVFHTVSTGLACSPTAAEARLLALYEVLERDPITIAGPRGLELRRVRPPHEPVLADLYQRLAEKHAHATVLDATTELGIPVRIALLEQRQGAVTACAVGMAA